MCRSVVWDRPQASPRLSRHPIEQGGQCTLHSSYRPAAVSDNAPVASTAGLF